MKAIAKVFVGLALGAGLSAAAMAQYNKPVGLSVHAGLFFTSSDTANSVEGRTWFIIGGDYKLGDMTYGGSQATYGIGFDYIGKGSFSSVPLFLTYTVHFPEVYVGAGVGPAFNHYNDGVTAGSNTDFGFGLKIGRDLNYGKTPAFIEAKYFGGSRRELSGFAIVAGVRF
ncbi:MAG: hypothetical protein KF857_11825 [Fimbriimonadaceae bacterium]|nr:hypothetical protein [Fimbriimonadaceae bacterium]